ncbi:hypothetical protein JCM19231_4256 [Vibrio ishigakensis]|uniref:Uncharacterized protein n=1 Tax=Vibrio ishigakensis TaxID=1481914 RepID=A0A0B8NZ09_9VIBR|nr:hypothetical protein [Vibrio ishigakensis]GAM59201.1 hypothetical protein JCM19231_4256 [Vibrio ishigakensis]
MDFTEKLRLREKAAEDIFFAARDRELIEAMHERQRQERLERAEEENPLEELTTSAK